MSNRTWIRPWSQDSGVKSPKIPKNKMGKMGNIYQARGVYEQKSSDTICITIHGQQYDVYSNMFGTTIMSFFSNKLAVVPV